MFHVMLFLNSQISIPSSIIKLSCTFNFTWALICPARKTHCWEGPVDEVPAKFGLTRGQTPHNSDS